MSSILLDEESEPTHLLKRTGLINKTNNTTDTVLGELEKTLQESTVDLPLGKALHLLLNVHGQVFDKAVQAVEDSSGAEISIKSIESPTVKALQSITHYISKDPAPLFKQIYDTLKGKILKSQPDKAAMRILGFLALHSPYGLQVQQCLADELKQVDKRGQLAAVLLLQFLVKEYMVSNNRTRSAAIVFFEPAVQAVEMRSGSATLLACSACELALQLSQCLLRPESKEPVEKEPTSKITEVGMEELKKEEPGIWEGLYRVVAVLEKWQTPEGAIEVSAYQELYTMIQSKDSEAWLIASAYMTPKAILSQKPLSIKKQKQLLSDNSQRSDVVLVIMALLQKGFWITLQDSPILSVEQEEIKAQVQHIFDTSMHLKKLVPSLVLELPQLFSATAITDDVMAQHIIDGAKDDNSADRIKQLAPMVLNTPESSICYLLMYVAQQDTQSKFAFDMLSYIIPQASEQVLQTLQNNLLSVAKSNNQACELLIKCMPFIDLRPLVKRLMEMSIVQDEREKMICIALVSKTLLEDRWANSSIVVYAEMIRDFKIHKGFVTPEPTDFSRLRKMTPGDLESSSAPHVAHTYSDIQVQSVSVSFMGAVQLWSTKVKEADFASALKQLVQYSYGIPDDGTWIDVWKHLSFAFASNHKLVVHVIMACTDILKMQISMSDLESSKAQNLEERLILFRLCPLLILQTIPKEAYDMLVLPKSYVDLITHKLQKVGIPAYNIKVDMSQNNQTPIYIELMEELLQRSMSPIRLEQSIRDPIDFYVGLINKLFCK